MQRCFRYLLVCAGLFGCGDDDTRADAAADRGVASDAAPDAPVIDATADGGDRQDSSTGADATIPDAGEEPMCDVVSLIEDSFALTSARLRVGPDDAVHIVWNAGASGVVSYQNWNGALSESERITTAGPNLVDVELVDGTPHAIVLQRRNALVFARDTTWAEVRDTAFEGFALAVDSSGAGGLTFALLSDANGLSLTMSTVEEAETRTLAMDRESAALRFDAEGELAIAWTRRDGSLHLENAGDASELRAAGTTTRDISVAGPRVMYHDGDGWFLAESDADTPIAAGGPAFQASPRLIAPSGTPIAAAALGGDRPRAEVVRVEDGVNLFSSSGEILDLGVRSDGSLVLLSSQGRSGMRTLDLVVCAAR